MLKAITYILLILAITSPALAQQNTPDQIFDGSTATPAWRNQHRNDGSRAADEGEYLVDLRLRFALDSEGKLIIRSRFMSGVKYDSAWEDIGVGNNTSPTWHFNPRLFSLEYSPTDQLSMKAGALRTSELGIKITPLTLMDDGWIDGARVVYSPLAKWASKIVVTVGQIDEYETPNALKRGWGSPNFVQVQVQGDLRKRYSYLAESGYFDGALYQKLVGEISTSDIIPFTESFVLEELIRSDQGHAAFSAMLKQAIKNANFKTTYSYKDESVFQTPKGEIWLDNFYRAGHQFSFAYSQPVKTFKRMELNAFARAGKTISGVPLAGNHGLRLEGGVNFNFNKPKKASKK